MLLLLGILGNLSQEKICDSNVAAFMRRPSQLPRHFCVSGVDRWPVDSVEANYLRVVAEKLLAKTGSAEGVNYTQADLKVAGDYQPIFDKVMSADPASLTIMAATASFLYEYIIPLLGAGLGKGMIQRPVNGTPRFGAGRIGNLILEKPLGKSYNEAKSILDLAELWFPGANFVMDHYAGRDKVIKLLRWLRYQATPDLFNSQQVESITVEVMEAIGIEGRVEYYDAHGAGLDFLVNHLLLVLTLILMNHEDDNSERAMLEVLGAASFDLDTLVTGQYEGYRREVRRDSDTETFVGVEGLVDTPRWQHCRMKLVHGKGADQRSAKIRIKYRNGKTRVIDLDDPPGFNGPTPYERMLTDAYNGNFQSYPTGAVVLGQFDTMSAVLDRIANTTPDPYLRGERGPQSAAGLFA